MSFRGKKSYNQHDDRGSGGFNGRHVSYKAESYGKVRGFNRTRRNDNFRKFIQNGDVEMTVRDNSIRGRAVRFTPLMSRRGAVNDNGNKSKRILLRESQTGWYQITLSHGKKYERQELLNAILTSIRPTAFEPVNVTVRGDDVSFFVDNEETAQAIYSTNFKIRMPDGWKMQFKVRPCTPYVQLDDTLKEKIKVAMSSMFNITTQHLNLSKFHANQEFLVNDLFVPLNSPSVLQTVFEIISKSVPNLQSLSLSNNKIYDTRHFVMLKRNLSNLKSLDLSKNKIRNLSKSLSCLQDMKLEVLVLDENPLCDDYDQTAYVSEVRKIFKSLRQLDGVQLPAPVDFGIEESQSKLPQSYDSFLCHPTGQTFMKQFLEEFFHMYDNQASRDGLLKAYADNAQFSMTAYSSVTGVNMSKYITESRNMKKVSNFERRSRMLHNNKMEIVRFLNTLPKTQHDLLSLTADLLVFKPELISLSVCGVFRETEAPENANKASFIKAFSRTFVLVQTGSGFSIINDMLSITNATPNQISKTLQSTVPMTPSTSSSPISPQAPVVQVSNPNEEELSRKRQMVTVLAMRTGMNLLWAEKCLTETNWHFDNALYAFNEFNKMGKIPQEAFDKGAMMGESSSSQF